MKDLTNTKIWIGNNPELSEKVQKRLFELGYGWMTSKKTIITAYYGINIRKFDLILTQNKKEFDSKEYKEIFLSDLFENEWIPKIGDKVIAIKNTITSEERSPICKGTIQTIVGISTTNNIWFHNDDLGYYLIEDWKLYIEKENLSKIPYTEWKVGDTITPLLNWSDNGKLTADKKYIITKFNKNNNLFMLKNNGKEDWSSSICFKLVNRISQDIVQNDFVLPKKWYVKATRENEHILQIWRDGNHTGFHDELAMFSDKMWGNIQVYDIDKYTEITFKQFQKYVLKESINTNQITQLNKKENECTSKKSISTEQPIKIRRSNISISAGIGIRRSSIKSSRSKIHVGSNNSYNQ